MMNRTYLTAAVFWLVVPTIPSQVFGGMLREKKSLTLAGAQKIAGASLTAAAARGAKVVVAVVDDAGIPILLVRGDGAQVASVQVALGKARTAAIFRRPSKAFEDQVKQGRVAALALPGATALQGGIPIVVGGQVIGAVGVSGETPSIDEDIAKAGAATELR